jgi:hypothetical protein
MSTFEGHGELYGFVSVQEPLPARRAGSTAPCSLRARTPMPSTAPGRRVAQKLPTSELALRLLHLIVEHGETRLLIRREATSASLWPAQRADIKSEDEYEILLTIGEAWGC